MLQKVPLSVMEQLYRLTRSRVLFTISVVVSGSSVSDSGVVREVEASKRSVKL